MMASGPVRVHSSADARRAGGTAPEREGNPCPAEGAEKRKTVLAGVHSLLVPLALCRVCGASLYLNLSSNENEASIGCPKHGVHGSIKVSK